MKINDMRELPLDELRQQVEDARKELFTSRMKHAVQQLENTAQLRMIKHRIAQLNTVIQEKEQGKISGGQK
jgi:large subunit ribosomal protein L29